MERLTKNHIKLFEEDDTKYDTIKSAFSEWEDIENMQECVDKLGQLEDLEEELGIDLVIKDKVEQHSMCYYSENNKIRRIVIVEYHRIGIWTETSFINHGVVDAKRIFLPYKFYGTTWALTMEEIEK